MNDLVAYVCESGHRTVGRDDTDGLDLPGAIQCPYPISARATCGAPSIRRTWASTMGPVKLAWRRQGKRAVAGRP